MSNGYKTVKSSGVARFVEKKSEFIGTISPITTEEEAKEFINTVSTQYKDASHNVYAYILRGGQIKRYSDDGEPQGSAGLPTLSVLEKENLVDVCVIATRYFGGTELGKGGLVRAYGHTAKIAIDEVGIADMQPCIKFTTSCKYDFYDKYLQILPKFSVVVLDTEFLEDVTLTMYVLKEKFQEFCDELTLISNGKIVPKIIEECFLDVNVFD